MDIDAIFRKCGLCPRRCSADRTTGKGFCGMPDTVYAARASLHKWEEPCIAYKNGAGTVFFSGCNLQCVYCQNNIISNELRGKALTVSELSDVFLRLQDEGADNIELVTPTHFVPLIIKALDIVRHRLNIPVVYNTGGYELSETIAMLDGYIDVYLPDIKYFSPDIAAKYSSAPDYFDYASKAVLAMISQVGKLSYNSEGGLLKGTVIRHLVFPSHRYDSISILEWIAVNTSPDEVLVSIMGQYTPFDFIPDDCRELRRKVTKFEYNSVLDRAAELSLNGFSQDRSSASDEYVPDFNFQGL